MKEEMLQRIKLECGISWDDDSTNSRLENIYDSGIEYMKKHFGDVDIEIPGTAQDVFLAHCKYKYFDQYEDFERNYLSELIQLRFEYEVSEHEKETKAKVS